MTFTRRIWQCEEREDCREFQELQGKYLIRTGGEDNSKMNVDMYLKWLTSESNLSRKKREALRKIASWKHKE